MTSTFLGKWRLSFQWAAEYDHYVVYRPTGYLTVLFTYKGPPVPESNIAFIRSADSKLCFQFNNGKYVKTDVGFLFYANSIADSAHFAFQGHEQGDPPASFKSKIPIEGTDRFLAAITGMVLPFPPAPEVNSFFVNQITPPLASIQTKGNGDGFDFGWVDFTGATLNKVSLIRSDFSHCNLTNFKFLNCLMKGTILNDTTLTGTDFSGSVLAGAKMNQLDLTGVLVNAPLPQFYVKPLQPPSPDNPRTNLTGSCLKQSLLDSDWSMLDLTGATIVDLPTPLSSQTKPLTARYSVLTTLNHNNFSDLGLQYAVFDHAVLDNVNLNGADLSNASLIQASMHGTVLSNATLKNAVMTGAQLGSLSSLFTLPAGYENHLNAGPTVDGPLRDQFAQHGIKLSDNASLNKQAPNRVWQLNDAGNNVIYTIRLETSDSTSVLTVYKPGNPASLVNAYMPDATLTGANLFGITANNIQLYGSKAKLDGSAILEEAKLNNSNLSTVDFTQAQLLGANLSHCHLFNAKFNNASLTSSAAGTVADLSHSNLQGANFTSARLFGANLTNAAVAIDVPTIPNPKQGGVYLFSLPYKGDTVTLDQYKSELTAAAASFFSLNPGGDATLLQKYLTALKNNDLATLRVPFLKHSPPIIISSNAQIQTVEVDSVWQIVDGTQSYTLWTGIDEEGKTELYAMSSLTKTRAAFTRSSMILRLQASAAADKPDQWLIDNDSENPKNFSTGYVKFVVKLKDNVLDVYGAALRILRMGENNQEEFTTETCQVTTISQTNMNADTVLPNGATLSVNQARSNKSWDTLWLRATQPPRPPDCVPTNNSWCPPSKTKM